MPFSLDLSKAQPLLARISAVFSPAVTDQILIYAGDRVGAAAEEKVRDAMYPAASGKALPIMYTRTRKDGTSYQSKFKSLAQQRYVTALASKGLLPYKRTGKLGQSIAWATALQGSGLPLEHGLVHIARANHSVTFPANVMLVGAMNPCPCGFLGSPHRTCRCPPLAVERYQRRLSGPLRDRFDLWLEIPALPWADMWAPRSPESSAVVRERVIAARARQQARQGCTNARLDGRTLQRVCELDGPEADRLLGRGVERFGLSARAVTRVLRVARTLADLGHEPVVRKEHVAEALQLRGPDLGV
jgi:hypothetical protein